MHESKTRVRFTVYQPGLSPQQVTLPAENITLGRASDCTIPIKDRFLSRRHAEILNERGTWFVRDCGSVNGTTLNGVKLAEPTLLHPGDRIGLGDSEVVFHSDETTSQFIAIDTDSHATNLAISVDDDEKERSSEKTQILSTLALEFLADRPMAELFDFILDRVVFLLRPTRAAIALLGDDRVSFANVKLRRLDATESNDLAISRTLLRDVVEGRKVVSYFDTEQNDKFARAQSIITQRIRSILCAPLMSATPSSAFSTSTTPRQRGDRAEDDVRLLAQIARFAAIKLETHAPARGSVRESEHRRRAAHRVDDSAPPAAGRAAGDRRLPFRRREPPLQNRQRRLLRLRRPSRRPHLLRHRRRQRQRHHRRADDVGRGQAVPHLLRTRSDAGRSRCATSTTRWRRKLPQSKFVTLFLGRARSGHGRGRVRERRPRRRRWWCRRTASSDRSTDIVVGIVTHAEYRNQTLQLAPGDSLVLFTDGVTEAENIAEEQLGLDPVCEMLRTMHGSEARRDPRHDRHPRPRIHRRSSGRR